MFCITSCHGMLMTVSSRLITEPIGAAYDATPYQRAREPDVSPLFLSREMARERNYASKTFEGGAALLNTSLIFCNPVTTVAMSAGRLPMLIFEHHIASFEMGS